MTSALEPQVEVLLGGTWVDLTAADDVLGRDKITIDRGRQDWASRVSFSRCRMSLKNKTGDFSPRNPRGQYYGLLARNVPVRVSMNGHRRFTGEITEWPTRVDVDRYVPIEACGILRRLNRGATTLRSTLYRELLNSGRPQPFAYWPAEDKSDATALSSALPGHPPMVIEDGIRLASYDGFAASDPIPVANNTRYYGDVPDYSTSDGATRTLAIVAVPAAGVAADGTPLITLNTSGSTGYWRLLVNMNGTVQMQITDPDSAIISTSSASTWSLNGKQVLLSLVLQQLGSTGVSWKILMSEVGGGNSNLTGTAAGHTYGRVWRVNVGAYHNLGDTAVGHIAVVGGAVIGGYLPDTVLLSAVNAWVGEVAGRRLERLCLEEAIPFGAVGNLDDTQAMGPQIARSALDLLYECADADGGILYEPIQVSRSLGTFEETLQGWAGSGTPAPAVALSTTRAYTGVQSMQITWGGGAGVQTVRRSTAARIFVPGVEYTFTARVWVPAGNTPVALVVVGAATGTASSLTGQWQQISVTWTATDNAHRPEIWASGTTTAGHQVWVDDMRVYSDQPGLQFRTLRSTYNAAPALEMDFDQRHVAPPFEPTEDDQYLANDVTVERTGASKHRVELSEGDLSTAAPPHGVGRYIESVSRNVKSDLQALNHAGWLVHLGTWNEQRYPQISVFLRRHQALIPQAAAVDVGSRITLANPPDDLPPGLVDQQVQGYRETLDAREWTITYNCTPNGVNRVAVWNESRYGSEFSTLNTAITTSQTSVPVLVQRPLSMVSSGSATASSAGTTSYLRTADADAVAIQIGDEVRLYDSAGDVKQDTVFTVTAKPSAGGFTNITFTPAAFESTAAGDVMVAYLRPRAVPWMTSAAYPTEFPFEAEMGGEVVNVTAIGAPVSGVQTFTVTRSVNGIVKAHAAGTKVRLATEDAPGL